MQGSRLSMLRFLGLARIAANGMLALGIVMHQETDVGGLEADLRRELLGV